MPPLAKWDAVVREIQHETGLPDDAFGHTASGDLLVEKGGGWGGALTRLEREGVRRVLESRPDLVAWNTGGAVRIEVK